MSEPSPELGLAVALCVALTGCAGASGEVPPPSPVESVTGAEAPSAAFAREVEGASAGIDDDELGALLREHWAARLELSPHFAMRLGVHDFDASWGPRGPRARAEQRERRASYLERARALAGGELGEADRLTLELFITELESGQAREVCELWAWSVSIRANPLSEIASLAETVDRVDDTSAAMLAGRYASFPALVDAGSADLRGGLARGLVADAESLARTVEMLERELALELETSSLFSPVAELAAADPRRVELGERLREDVRPALTAYAELLRAELLPAARGEQAVGLGALAIGSACYAALIEHHTSETPSAEALHALGLAEIARIDAEFRELGARALGTGELDEVLARLRSDPELYFETAEEVEAFARESLAAAQAAAPAWFGHLPATPCEVERIPDYEAPYTTIAYYEQPGEGEPGTYFINTYAPTTRPRYEARVLAIHEAVPGHHTQIALAQELPDAPAFRRHGGTTVFVEGWALYTERLADEMGLYASDLDRLGVLSFDAWRASRLVVDTGLHAKGWTRQQAVDFMLMHTALAENNIVNEVDRYVGWPAQALAYKYGQLELLRLRAEAEAALGDRFEITDFHDLVLGAGAVTLPILRRRVEAWVAERRVDH